jgi:hypothetical protein
MFWPRDFNSRNAEEAGFRFGNKGTQTSRTIMLAELTSTLSAAPADSNRAKYAAAIIESNCLGKRTTATRRLTNQRLGELYALEPSVQIFRVLRRLWSIDELGRPLLALLVALARDPLLTATAPAVIPLQPGAEFQRNLMRDALRAAVGERLNDSTLAKVVRNAASSWTQARHLQGRTFKFRHLVKPTAGTVALALYLGYTVGFRGDELLASGWVSVLDCTPLAARNLALDAKRLGLIDLRLAADVMELKLERLDPWYRRG